MLNCVFVYGLLKETVNLPALSGQFSEKPRLARASGQMLAGSLGFPGAVFEQSENYVYGMVLFFKKEMLKEIIESLDLIEGYSPEEDTPSLYIREIITAELTEPTSFCKAYAYGFDKYNIPDGFIEIPGQQWTRETNERYVKLYNDWAAAGLFSHEDITEKYPLAATMDIDSYLSFCHRASDGVLGKLK